MDYQKAQEPPHDTPRKARMVTALGLNWRQVTDDDLRVHHHGNVVGINYTGIILMTPEEFALATKYATPPPLDRVDD